jgi:hypothetical protein
MQAKGNNFYRTSILHSIPDSLGMLLKGPLIAWRTSTIVLVSAQGESDWGPYWTSLQRLATESAGLSCQHHCTMLDGSGCRCLSDEVFSKKPPACSRFSRVTVCTILPLSVILCVVCCSVLQVRVVHCFGNLCGFLLAHGLSIAEFRPRGPRTWHVPQLWHTDSDGQMRSWMWQLGSQSCCIIDEIWMPSGGRRGWADCWQVYIGQACTCVSLNLAVSKGHLSLSISMYIYLYLSPSIYICPYLLISVHTYLYLSKSIHIY